MKDYSDKDEDEYGYITYAYKYFDDLIENETIYKPLPKTYKLGEVPKPSIFEKFLPPSISDLEKYEKEFNETQEQTYNIE
jgi:hypothetical protein